MATIRNICQNIRCGEGSALLKNTVPEVLDLAREHQTGRGTGDVPTGTFTEGWFRKGGLYDLKKK